MVLLNCVSALAGEDHPIITLFIWAIAADMPFTFKAGDLISQTK